jgi:hypothetical protein
MNLSFNVNFFLGLQSQIKINHWQTKSYARHEAFNDFYEGMNPLIDDYVELSISKNGRFILNDESDTVRLVNIFDLDMDSFVNTLKIAINQISTTLNPSDDDLMNILDEMLGQVNKLSYRLSLT